MLLLRVRDEIRMTIAAYRTLYESSVAFGIRKALQAEQGKSDTENKVVTAVCVTLFSNFNFSKSYYSTCIHLELAL